uniref:Uncharacterized protein n=1 Tax=Zonotrichia albicollis TaxID=44394 RepID=A0A8D2MUB6_ZONAL
MKIKPTLQTANNKLCLFLYFLERFPCRQIASHGDLPCGKSYLRIIQLDIPGMEECLNIASSIEVSSCHQPENLQVLSSPQP